MPIYEIIHNLNVDFGGTSLELIVDQYCPNLTTDEATFAVMINESVS